MRRGRGVGGGTKGLPSSDSVLIGGHQRGTPEEIKNRDEGGRVRIPGHQVRGRLDLKHLSL